VSRIAIVEAFVTAWNAMDFSPIHAIAEANDQLLTKWSDRFLLATGTSTKMPVMGIFAFDAARRCRVWRGYFNWGQFQMEFAK